MRQWLASRCQSNDGSCCDIIAAILAVPPMMAFVVSFWNIGLLL
jgi:hypothetical protein